MTLLKSVLQIVGCANRSTALIQEGRAYWPGQGQKYSGASALVRSGNRGRDDLGSLSLLHTLWVHEETQGAATEDLPGHIHTNRKWLVPQPSDLFILRCEFFFWYYIIATNDKYRYPPIGRAWRYWGSLAFTGIINLLEKHGPQKIGIERKHVLINSYCVTCMSSKRWKIRIFTMACAYKTE